MTDIKVGDCVVLKTSSTPKMTVSAIHEAAQTATVVWFNDKQRRTNTDVLPLNVLKLYKAPPPIRVIKAEFSRGL